MKLQQDYYNKRREVLFTLLTFLKSYKKACSFMFSMCLLSFFEVKSVLVIPSLNCKLFSKTTTLMLKFLLMSLINCLQSFLFSVQWLNNRLQDHL